MKVLFAVVSTLAFIVLLIIQIVLFVRYEQDIGGHLKRAADANTVELSRQELKTAIANIESEGLTTGYTSVLWRTPDEDLGFWYTNIKTAEAELDSLPPTTTPLERSNMLIKLRETLLDHTKDGDSVTDPSGISRFPNNKLFFWLNWILPIVAVGFWFAVHIEY